MVPKCTLKRAQRIKVAERTYCAVNIGDMSQLNGIAFCKELNAKLPLPKNERELKAFLKFSPNRTWIDLRDPAMTGKRQNWKDSQGKTPVFVKERVELGTR